MYKLNLIFILFFPVETLADYFKWEILVYQKSLGTIINTVPVFKEGTIKLPENDFTCRMESFWTRIESELLLESKTLICKKGANEGKVILVCSDNNRNRKYNNFKEIYPISKKGFLLIPNLGSDSPYLELRCLF